MATKKEIRQLAGHTAVVHALAFSPDGKQILTGSADRTLRFWDARTGKELRKLDAHAGYVRGIAFTRDGSVFASVAV